MKPSRKKGTHKFGPETREAALKRIEFYVETGLPKIHAIRRVAKEMQINFSSVKKWVWSAAARKRKEAQAQKTMPPSVLPNKTELDPDSKRIEIQQMHRQPQRSGLSVKSSEPVKPEPEQEIRPVLNNGKWACWRCKSHHFIVPSDQEQLVRCELCGILLSTPDNERGDPTADFPSGKWSFMSR